MHEKMQEAFIANWNNMATAFYLNQIRMTDMLNPSGTKYSIADKIRVWDISFTTVSSYSDN